MGLFDSVRGEFIDILEWLDDTRDTIVWRFPRHDNEIKMGAKLVVREGQVAVFVNEGRAVDVFTPGTYTLETRNLPILSTLRGWKYGFDSPFKAEVYFVSTRLFTDMKWGTQNPAMMRDPEFGMVRVRAFGTFALQVRDPSRLLTELVSTDPSFTTDEISEYLRQSVVSRLVTALASSGIPVLDLAAKQGELGSELADALTLDLTSMGLSMPRLVIENVSLPPEVEAAIDQRTRMGVLGDVGRYTQFQAADAIGKAAENPGGLAGAGAGLGAGAVIGAQMAQALSPQPAPASPPPLPQNERLWHLGIRGSQVGPLSAAEVQGKVASGEVDVTTLAWKPGMSGWVPLSETELGASVPPPLPPQ